MSEEQNVSNEERNEVSESSNADTVDHSSFKKLLNQRKNDKSKMAEMASTIEAMQAKLQEYGKKEEKIQQTKLEEQQQYAELKKRYEERIKALDEQEHQRKQEEIRRQKIDLFKKELPGQLRHEDYLKLANLNNITVHPDQGIVDEVSVKEAVDEFVKNHPHLIDIPQEKKPLPSESPKSGAPSVNGDIKNMSKEQLMELLSKQL